MDGSSTDSSSHVPFINPPSEPVPPFYSLPPLSLPTFYQLYQQQPHDVEQESDPNSIEEMRTPTWYRTRSRKYYYETNEMSYNKLTLRNGRVLRFEEEDGLYLLLPHWFESNPFVRKIVSQLISHYGASRSLRTRLRYLDKIMEEEEGYDEDGEMTYYHLRDQVIESYLVELRLRSAMRKVLVRWRNYRIDKRHCEEVDPITLCPPEKRVILYDWNVRKKFIFDAKSLAIHIETALSYQEFGFPIPRYPRNPWNNVDFRYRQLISIYQQLKGYGELRWGMVTFHRHHYNIITWMRYEHSSLTMKAVQTSLLQLDSAYAKEVLLEFIITKIEEVGNAQDFQINAYRLAILQIPNHWYIQQWKQLAYLDHEARHFGINRIEKINEARDGLLRKQPRFFHELIELRIVQRI